jgi:hypothetical protein
MTGKPDYPELASAVQTLLDQLRRRIWRYVWIEGLALAVAWLGFAFWTILAIDWFFEPPPAVRVVFQAVVIAGLVAIVVQRIVQRLRVPLSDASMALLLERYYPQFNESLITAVELSSPRVPPTDCNPHMLAHTCRLAAEHVQHVRLEQVFNSVPLRRNAAVAVLLGVAIAGFAVNSPDALGVWLRRNLLLSSELWPRNTRLLVDGFRDGVVKVARGSDLTVIAKADLAKPQVPNVVEVRYRTDGGARLHARMIREGTADPHKDKFQDYSHIFAGILTPIQFDVIGGDDAVRNLRVEVVDSPTTTAIVLDCRYPAYAGRTPRSLPVTGVMQIPVGSDVTTRAQANKELETVLVESGAEDSQDPPAVLRPARGSNRRQFTYRLSTFSADTTLAFTLLDTDGIKSREPVRVTLAALPDEKPQVNVHLGGIGSAITNRARLPAVGRVSDDYGIAKTWFDYTINQKASSAGPSRSFSGNPTDLAINQAMEVGDLKLTAGQKLSVSLKAADRCDLTPEPNVGSSDRWLLDVVTPEQLRTMLESRELVLRQRFESIIQDVTETRDLLARMEFSSKAAPAAGEKKPSASEKKDAGREPGEASGGEPGDKAAASQPVSPERMTALRTLRVERAMQNSQKDAQEILGVADAFSDIREELINNRIDTEELKQRLENGIASPLRRVANEMFPELDHRLDKLQAAIADENASPENLARATQQLDSILAALRRVLDRMIELEDFNEAVELLREIVHDQDRLHDLTKQRQKQKLRDLLE